MSDVTDEEDCEHPETHTSCDGLQHIEVCDECGEDVSYSACPEAGSFPTEPCEDDDIA